MSFKEDVEFYLGLNKKFDYYGFDIANDSIAEEDEEESEEASVKTKCPVCGKTKCACKSSKRTGTPEEEDDDGWHASTGAMPADFGATPEEIEMLKLIKKNGGFGNNFVPETPEEKEMLKLAAEICKSKKSKAAVKDDKTAGYAPSCDTSCDTTSKKSLKEEILNRL